MPRMTDAPPTRAKRFAAIVVPAAERAGYTGHGSKARFARDTGMTESSVTRLWKGQGLPDPRFFGPIAKAASLHLGDLLVETGILSRESLQALSETEPSQVRSRSITPAEAADRLGLTDEVAREMLKAAIERQKRMRDVEQTDDERGGATAQM